jgi:hypothetical protein
MCPNLANKRTLPKFAIAKGYLIGSFPQEIEFTNKDGKRNIRDINDNELTDLLKAMIAPVGHMHVCLHILGDLKNQ